MKKTISVLLLLCMLTMLLPVAALANGEEAAVTPAAEQTAEVNTEDSAEPPAAGTSKEIVDVPASGESADDTVVAESKGEADGEYEDEIVPNGSAAEDNSDETITAETMASTNEMAAALTLEGEGNAEAQTYYLSCRASNGTTTVTVDGEPIEFDDQVPAGATVKIVTTGDEGYVRLKADMIYVIGNGPSAQYMKLDAVESPAGTFTFTMPAYRVDAQFYFFTDAAAKLTHHVTMSDGTEETWTEYATKDVPYWVTMEKAQWVYLAESERISGWTLGSPTGEKLSEGYHVFTEDTDLYAVVEDGVKITFHYPNYEYSYYVAKNEKTHLPTTQWLDERDGKYAIGWSTNPDGSGTVYYDDTSPEYDSSNTGYAFSRDTDFYLTYREPVTVRCYDGEDLIGSEKIGKGGQYTLPDRVGKSGLIQYWLVGSADSETRYLPWQRVQINEDTDLYAVFAEGEISLLFHDGNQVTASGIYPKNAEITIDVRLDGPSVPKDQAFLGWSLEPNGELLGQTVRFSEDTTLYAKFAPAVLVVYDPNGGECNDRYGGRYSRAVGSYLTNFTAADNFVTREGYTLKGWSLSKDGTELYDFSKPITGHTTLYAVWEGAPIQKYTVTFDDVRNGNLSITADGQPIENRSEVAVGALVTVTVTFKGDGSYGMSSAYWAWNDAETHEQHDLTVTETTPGTFTFTMPAGEVLASMTLYPSNAVKLTYHFTQPDGSEKTRTSFAPYNAPELILLDTGYSFTLAEGKRLTGWAVGSPAGEKLTEGYYTFTENTDLYAVIEDGVKLTKHYSNRVISDYVTKGDLTVVEYDGVRDGKYLIKWSSEPDGGGTIYDASAGAVYRFYEDTELYPVYMDYVTLRIHYGEQTSERPIGTKEAFTVSSFVFDPAPNPVAYWAVGSADSETRYLPGQTVYFETDTDLYAGPAGDMVTLRLHDTGCYPDSYYFEAAVKNEEKLLPDYDHDGENRINPPIGKAFLGWSKTPDGDLIGQTATFSENTDLYAVYGPAALVVYDANGGEYERWLNGRYSYAIGRCLTNYTAADNFVTREGYTLKGWSLSKDGTELYDFSKPITGHTTLYAVWEGAEPADVVISDTNNSGVTVTLPNGTQVEGVALVAVPLTGEDNSVALAVLGKQLGQTAGKSYVLDIYFTKAGEEVSVEGRRTVTVPIPENWNAANTAVYYIDPEKGTVQNMNGVVSADGKTISFVTDHFSYYALVEVKAADADPTPAPTPAASAAPTTAPTSSGAQSPKTGDEANLALWLLLATVSALGLGYVCMKKKEEK